MRSIERRFANVLADNPGYSTYTAFAEAVRGQQFGVAVLRQWFDKLVDRDDYKRGDKEDIIKHLELLNSTEEEKNKAE